MCCSIIMKMQSQGYCWMGHIWNINYQLDSTPMEMMTKTQYRQNNIEPLNMTQYWYPYCHLDEMVDKSIECIFVSK